MTVPIDGYTYVELVAGADTLPEHSGLNGVLMAVPTGADIGSGPLNPGKIKGVFGYPDGVGDRGMLRWVLSNTLPGVAKAFIAGLPDIGWVDPAARTAVEDIARSMVARGIPMPDVGAVLTAIHNAAVSNERVHRQRQQDPT